MLLHEVERDCLKLYFEEFMPQYDIAKLYGCCQGSISTRIKRAIQKLKYISHMKILDYDYIKSLIGKELALIVTYYYRTTSQTKTAQLVNNHLKLTGKKKMSQIKVRTRVGRALRMLKKYNEDKEDVKITEVIKEIEKTKRHKNYLSFCIVEKKYYEYFNKEMTNG